MRHTPCGCAPYGVLLPISRARISESKVLDLIAHYGEGAFHIRRARPLGVPTAKRQMVQTNEFMRIW